MNFSQIVFGTFSIDVFAIFVALAFIVSSWYFYKEIAKGSLSTDFFTHHFWKWVLAGILVGRILAVLIDWSALSAYGFWSFFMFWEGKIDVLGFVWGSLGMMYWDLKHHGKSFWKWSDAMFPGVFYGAFIYNLGAFFTGSVYGSETSMPWGIQYETFGVQSLAPLHPIPLYAIFLQIILYFWWKHNEAALAKISGKKSFVLTFWMLLISLFVSFWRGDFEPIWYWIKVEPIVLLFALGALLYAGYIKKQKTGKGFF